MKNEKIRVIVLLVLLAAVIAAAVLILRTQKAADGPVLTGAKTAWAAAGRTDRPESVHYIEFSDASALTADETPDASAALVPIGGCAYVFAPSRNAAHALDGLKVVFLDKDGALLSVLDYSQLNTLSDLQGGDAAYIDAATYVLSLYLQASESSLATQTDLAANRWYSLTEDQITDMMK